MGFEPRMQLDLYLRTDQEGDDSEMLIGQQVELRYALADWGKLWGNPTIYLEWAGLEQRPERRSPAIVRCPSSESRRTVRGDIVRAGVSEAGGATLASRPAAQYRGA